MYYAILATFNLVNIYRVHFQLPKMIFDTLYDSNKPK